MIFGWQVEHLPCTHWYAGTQESTPYPINLQKIENSPPTSWIFPQDQQNVLLTWKASWREANCCSRSCCSWRWWGHVLWLVMVSSLPLSQVTSPALISPPPLSKLPHLHHDQFSFLFFVFFFFSQILEVGPKEGLARFVYRLERKVEKLRNSTVHDGYMLAPIV